MSEALFALSDDSGLDDQWVSVVQRGEHVIIDICLDEVETGDWTDGSGRLAALALLRAALIAGDHSMLLLLWLTEVDMGWIADDATMPMPSPGHLSAPLAALAEYFGVDGDLLSATFGDNATPKVNEPSPAQAAKFIRDLVDAEKTDLLLRLYAGEDPHLSAELRRRCRQSLGLGNGQAHADGRLRTAGEFRGDAAERATREQRRKEALVAAARAKHLDALAKRGEAVWREVEELIEQRNAKGYDQATALLVDLTEIPARKGQEGSTTGRIAELIRRHDKKGQFIRRLTAVGLLPA
jgi:hypothetical protein